MTVQNSFIRCIIGMIVGILTVDNCYLALVKLTLVHTPCVKRNGNLEDSNYHQYILYKCGIILQTHKISQLEY